MSATSSVPSSSPRLPPSSSSRVPVREVLPLDALVVDGGTQVRSAIDDDVVLEYVDALVGGAQFPPVVVFRADGVDLLSDGFHRVVAYRKAGRSEIEADVYPGTRDEALWFALGANRTHGQRLSRADKRHAVELAYRAWPDLSQARIAGQVGCSQQYVSKVRAQLTTSCELPDRVVGIDGRRRAATRLAPSSSPASSPPADSAASASSVPAVPSGDASSLSSTPSGALESSQSSSAQPVAEAQPSETPTSPRVDVDSSTASDSDARDGVSESSALAAAQSEVSEPEDSRPDSSSSADGAASPGSPRIANQSARDRSNRIVSLVAYDAKNLIAQQDLIVFGVLDRDRVPVWIGDLEEARRGLGRLIRRLREEVEDGVPSETVEG